MCPMHLQQGKLHTYIYIYIYLYLYIYIYIYVYIYIFVFKYIYIYTNIYIDINIYCHDIYLCIHDVTLISFGLYFSCKQYLSGHLYLYLYLSKHHNQAQ
jgi:hypothetical protein